MAEAAGRNAIRASAVCSKLGGIGSKSVASSAAGDRQGPNHAYSVAIHFMHYNFVRIHQSLRITPALAPGVSDTLWSLTNMARVTEEWEVACAAKPGDRLIGRSGEENRMSDSGQVIGAID